MVSFPPPSECELVDDLEQGLVVIPSDFLVLVCDVDFEPQAVGLLAGVEACDPLDELLEHGFVLSPRMPGRSGVLVTECYPDQNDQLRQLCGRVRP